MNKETFKNPKFWAIAIPILLFLFAITSTSNMLKQRRLANNKMVTYKKVIKNVASIASFRNKKGGKSDLGFETKYFTGVNSADACAKAAFISPAQFRRGEFSKPTLQKDGRIEHRETYNLNNVTIVQVAQFIDYAERHYDTVRCSVLSISHSQSKAKDNWDATMTILYRTPKN